VWSPDGTKIAFSSLRGNAFNIWIMNPDGTGAENLTKCPSGQNNFEPYWTPDSSSILFRSHRDGNGEIYIMNRDGSNVRNLTKSGDYEADPSVSTSGSGIVFYRGADIYRMNIDGSNPVNLTNSGEFEGAPTW
jgi:TolB protein